MAVGQQVPPTVLTSTLALVLVLALALALVLVLVLVLVLAQVAQRELSRHLWTATTCKRAYGPDCARKRSS